jgi:hypothetical protein
MGQVFLSFTPGGRAVAVKVVRREFADDPEFRARLNQEALAAQRVSGIHIAQLLDRGTDSETPWLATVYVPGPNLAEAVRNHGPLPVATVRMLMAAVADSLRVIHSTGIVHRDLKPGNVVLSSEGPRVIDFGIARATDGTALTLSGGRIGSPAYTAPEQVLGRSATAAVDVFALGALGYFAATGRTAFGEGPDFGIVYRVVNEEPDLTGCPAELYEMIAACLAKDPAGRPTTAEVVEAYRADERFLVAADWLPAPVAEAIAAREEAVAVLGSAPPAPVPPMPAAPPVAPEAPAVPTRPVGRRPSWIWPAAVLLVVGMAAGALLAINLRDKSSTSHDNVQGTTGSGPATAGQTQPAAGRTTGSAESPAPSVSLPTATDDPPWTGTIRFGENGILLDPVPPQQGASLQFDIALRSINPPRIGALDGTDLVIAQWTGTAMPTRQDCANLVSTQGVWELDAVVGKTYCVGTREHRFAALTVTSATNDFSTGVTGGVTVWRTKSP